MKRLYIWVSILALTLGIAMLTAPMASSRAEETLRLLPPVNALYDTADVIIADINAADPPYSADRTGRADATRAIQQALNQCAERGGGTVWLPAGVYRIEKAIRVPAFVTLRGDFNPPDAARGGNYGTLIAAYPSVTGKDLPALFTIGGSGGVVGMTIYYPEQRLDDVKHYPYTFYIEGLWKSGHMLQTIANVTVLNGYTGIAASTDMNPDHAHE